MKSITEMIDFGEKDERTLCVQISEGGRVSLSFDGNDGSMQVSMTSRDLVNFKNLIGTALAQRQAQVEQELENVS